MLRKSSSGITTFRDNLVVGFNEIDLEGKRNDLAEMGQDELRVKYSLADSRDWKLSNVQKDLPNSVLSSFTYRPFDFRKVFYSSQVKGVLSYPRYEVMQHMLHPNLGLLLAARVTSFESWHHVYISNFIAERCSVSLQTGEVGYLFPLYLYHEDGTKTPNFNVDMASTITKAIGEYTPEQLFDYIYSILHAPQYRSRYKEFLKIDFPRIPYPKNRAEFEKLASIGTKLRELHLLQSPMVEQSSYAFPESGSDIVEKVEYKEGKVYINQAQYFDEVPRSVWDFYIGGYQPAQKWLKDRKDRKLEYEDLRHYQKVITALSKTIEITEEIDLIVKF